MSEILRINDLGKTFGATRAVEDASLAVNRGERLAVLGRSGSGKTTMLRLIAGLEAPSTGEICIAGSVASRSGRVLVPPEARGVALVFQGLALFPNLRALDQIAFAARGRGGLTRARSLLDRLGLGHRADARLDELSGGERQRIALGRALVQEPALILMDEPFASLDDDKRAEMRDLLRSLLDDSKATLILVSHCRADAFDLAHRVAVLDHGRLVADDALETLVARPRHAAAVRALGLGQLSPGRITATGEAQTAFGSVRTPPNAQPGPVLLLVRPDQPLLVADDTDVGVEAEVSALERRPTEGHEIRRVAVVRVSAHLLRVQVPGPPPAVGDRVRVRIEGVCEPVDGV